MIVLDTHVVVWPDSSSATVCGIAVGLDWTRDPFDRLILSAGHLHRHTAGHKGPDAPRASVAGLVGIG